MKINQIEMDWRMRGPVAVTAWCEKETKEFVAGVEVVYKDEVEGEDRLRFDGERQLLYFDAYELAERIMMHQETEATGSTALPLAMPAGTVRIDLRNNRRLAKKMIGYLLYRYFGRKACVERDFTGQTVAWIEEGPLSGRPKVVGYLRYRLVPCLDAGCLSGWLQVSYEGKSYVDKGKAAVEMEMGLGARLMTGREVMRYGAMDARQRSRLGESYWLVNRELKDRLRIDTDWYSKQKEEVYRKRVDRITAFRKQWLESADLQAYGLHFGTEWKDVGRECVRTVPPVARQLSFGNGTGIEPSCIKLYRPFSGVPNKQYRFIFIYQSGNEALHAMAQKLYCYFAYGSPDGKQINPQLQLGYWLGTVFDKMTCKDEHIKYRSRETMLVDVETALLERQRDPQFCYFAFCVTPYSKLKGVDEYYKLKELLLRFGIGSQFVSTDSISKSDFASYPLPNIYTSVLAKLGGVPWKITVPMGSGRDLVVGVGAFRSQKADGRYVGGAFYFMPDGHFLSFDCFKGNNLDRLAENLRSSICDYIQTRRELPSQVVIHYYKAMSQKEWMKIDRVLQSMKLRVPVTIVTVNKTEENDILSWEPAQSSCLMPLSGTYVRLGGGRYLLFNNDYYQLAQTKKRQWLPLKLIVSRRSASGAALRDPLSEEEEEKLLGQIYQFSRIGWKSVSVHRLPVTLRYPEMLAQMVPFFQEKQLNLKGRTSLWFL